MSEIYYAPEKVGVIPVAEYDLYGKAYEFTLVVVWRDADGNLWGAHDSGCSCPTPFEDHAWPTDFTEIRSRRDVETLIEQANEGYRAAAQPATEFLCKVDEALKVRA